MGRFKLDRKIRAIMLEHLSESPPDIPDILTERGRELYLDLVKTAFAEYDEEWLFAQLVSLRLLHQGLEAEARKLVVGLFEQFVMVAILDEWLRSHPEALRSPVQQKPTWVFEPPGDGDVDRFLEETGLVEPYSRWVRCWWDTLKAVGRWGAEVSRLLFERPASEEEVVAVERALGRRLPVSLRRVFREFSKGFEFSWSFYDQGIPLPLERVYSGGFEKIGLSWLVKAEEERQSWIQAVFSDPHDPYSAVWHNTLLVIFVGNGDYIGIDVQSDDGFVTYVSHEGYEALHGKVLANNFLDFMNRWSLLGCVGPEDWQLEVFVGENGLDPFGEKGQVWRKWLGLSC